MHLDYIDVKRQSWDVPTLAALLSRLTASGYVGLAVEGHRLVGRFARAQGDRPLTAALTHANGFADVLIPPAQPHARIILYLLQPDVLRVVVAGRDPSEVKRIATATKMHIEATMSGSIDEIRLGADERDSVSRFRREAVPALNLAAASGLVMGGRDGAPMQMIVALRRQPAFRGRPTALGSQIGTTATVVMALMLARNLALLRGWSGSRGSLEGGLAVTGISCVLSGIFWYMVGNFVSEVTALFFVCASMLALSTAQRRSEEHT